MRFVAKLAVAALPLASAVPTSPPSSCPVCSNDYVANFDDLGTVPFDGPGGPAVPTPYKGLAFSPLDVASEALVPAILYKSPPNAAVTETLTTVTGQATIVFNSQYPGSKVKTFDLHSFYFGCKTPSVQQGNGGLAVACSLAVTGYKPRPQQPEVCDKVGPVQVGFNPTYTGSTAGVLLAPMAKADLGNFFAGITNATLSVSTTAIPGSTIANTTIVYIDEVDYRTSEVCCK